MGWVPKGVFFSFTCISTASRRAWKPTEYRKRLPAEVVTFFMTYATTFLYRVANNEPFSLVFMQSRHKTRVGSSIFPSCYPSWLTKWLQKAGLSSSLRMNLAINVAYQKFWQYATKLAVTERCFTLKIVGSTAHIFFLPGVKTRATNGATIPKSLS